MAISKVLTGKCRLSYPKLFTPESFGQAPGAAPGPDAKYSCVLLIRKDDPITVSRLQSAVESAIQEAIPTKWGGKRPANLRLPLRDGDAEREGDEYKGCYFINCTTKRKPHVVDRDCCDIIDPSEIYAGCYVRATLNCYSYDYAGNRGISFGLCNVQKLGDGEPLGGGGATGAADFGSAAAKAEIDDLDDF